jgi:predicted ATPase
MPDLALGPLTIFAGANSSGKSTFIQSILLVAQTLSHKVGSRSVVLNGALTSLGQFDDLKSKNTGGDSISIKLICRPLQDRRGLMDTVSNRRIFGRSREKLDEVTCEISFDSGASSSERDIYQLQPRLVSTRLIALSQDEENADKKSSIYIHYLNRGIDSVRGLGISGDLDDPVRRSLNYSVNLDSDSAFELQENFVSAKPIGCTFNHFLPERIICEIDPIREDANLIASSLLDIRRGIVRRHMTSGREGNLTPAVVSMLREILVGKVDFDQIFFSDKRQESLLDDEHDIISLVEWNDRVRHLPLDQQANLLQALREKEDFLDLIYDVIRLDSGSDAERKEIVAVRVPRNIAESSSYLDRFYSSSLKYLGPLRDAPKPLYPLAPAADPFDIGLRGEHTALILDLHKHKKVRYIPSDTFKKPSFEYRQITRTLEAAVMDWLQYLGVAEKVESQDKGKLGHELKVSLSDSDYAHDLTHVGVGVSQVLPILVMCLLAEEDSTLVFEQPELHLHPKVQSLLGDFFLSMALSNRQCLVETHSEYLIDRLRFRIASSPLNDNLEQNTKIYFVEKPAQETKFREVNINEYGAITDWPEGFFDQSQQQAEAILTAALAKKRAKKNKD